MTATKVFVPRGPSYPAPCRSSRLLSMPGRRFEEYALPDREASAPNDGAVHPGLVVPRPDDRLQHFRGGAGGAGVEVHHRTALVAIADGDDGGFVGISEREDAAHPFVFLEGDGSQRRNQDVGSE